MIRFDDYPCAQFREALGSVLGRVGLILAALLIGSMLGGLTATRSLEGLLVGVIGLPELSIASFLFGAGFVVFPLILLYAFVSIRCEWPLMITLLCSALMWWNVHKTIRWTAYDSPMAREQQKMQEKLDQAMEKASEQRTQ